MFCLVCHKYWSRISMAKSMLRSTYTSVQNYLYHHYFCSIACDTPPTVDTGLVAEDFGGASSPYPYGTTVTYTCQNPSTHLLLGSATATCSTVDGTWSLPDGATKCRERKWFIWFMYFKNQCASLFKQCWNNSEAICIFLVVLVSGSCKTASLRSKKNNVRPSAFIPSHFSLLPG